ncbi:mRNA capping enzyme beta chain [Peziza echinospora]|nr:mRNA capping enzyme beta chain [Peziza echinospora]
MPNRRGPPAQLIQQQHQQQLQQQQEIQQAGHLTPIQRQNTGPPSGGHAPPPPQPPAPVAAPAPLTQPPTVQPPNRIPNHFEHPLAPWEPSITNSIPYDEITHKVTEFIFNNVVKFDDPTVDWTNSGGPVIEIEAKLGHIIARNTNERLRIGIRSEAILDYFDYSFRSSMTEQQHKRFNSFLNDRFAETQPKNPPPPRSPSPSSSPSQANNHSQPRQFSGPPPRVPMEYKHTRERDTFRDLAPQTISSLPPLIQKLSKKPPRVRVTTDQQGKVIHKIIKCRIADLNVLSPCTAFDWRVSVNLEMPYTGGLEEKDGVIVPKPGGKGNSIERNKDRMSYKCLGGKFKVDLTQVTGNDHAKKEHELEIELDTMAVKRQGTLAMRNSPNGFEELVKGFVNNIRVLTRAVDG